MRENQGGRSGVFEFLADEFRGAMNDIRRSLIDEGWFGRKAPERGQSHSSDWTRPDIHGPRHTGPAEKSFEEMWAPRDPGSAPEHGQAPGIDMDR